MRLAIAIFLTWALYSALAGYAVMGEAGSLSAAYFGAIAAATAPQ